ncbi:hypothetical protein GH810_02600 [Acetobacterium paludosum]|uniref:DUF308 domain-containing protein n=1 Tax=Acetobacterium paludosum TaxID=52693 RepID=A0A923HR63_9FIRM|nr:DUF308 domain-containing protein [Acetobacterium paludosum]MBC3887198.1 hypothetical protein [Acetobacterium paludosum]
MNRSEAKSLGVEVLERSYGKWWLMLLDGLCYLALCALTIINSNLALTLLVFVFGVYRGVMGALYLISALIIRHKYGSSVNFSIGRGIFDLVICAIFLLVPNLIVSFFIFIIGIWAIITGIFLLIISGNSEGFGKMMKIVIGIALIAFGIYAFIDPMGPAGFFMVIIGIVLGIMGIFLVIQAIEMKKNYAQIKREEKGYDDYKVE